MAKQRNNNVLFYFAVVITIPLSVVLWKSSAKVLDVFMLQRHEYIFTNTILLENVNKKYGDRSTFRINYNSEVVEGRDRGVWWSKPGDIVRVYFNKKNLYDNGINAQLISLTAGQWLFFMALITYIISNYSNINLYEKNT